MITIRLIDARRRLHQQCESLFRDKKVADQIYWYLCDGLEECDEVEPERKKGRWIEHEVKGFDGCHTGRFFDECSECGKLTPEWRKVTEYHRWYFCPNCGADMRGEQDE